MFTFGGNYKLDSYPKWDSKEYKSKHPVDSWNEPDEIKVYADQQLELKNNPPPSPVMHPSRVKALQKPRDARISFIRPRPRPERDTRNSRVQTPTRQNNQYTKICKSTLNNSKCSYRNCMFAHSLEELEPSKCTFNNRCKYKDTCKFIHQFETKDKYVARLYGVSMK